MQFLYIPKVGNSVFAESQQPYETRIICIIKYENYEVNCYANRKDKKIITKLSYNNDSMFNNNKFDSNDWEMYYLQKVVYSDNWMLLLTIEGTMLACGNNCNYQIGLQSSNFSCVLTRVLPGIAVDNFCIFPYGNLVKQYMLIVTKCNKLYAAGINSKNRMGIGKSEIATLPSQVQLPDSGKIELYKLADNYSIILIDKVEYYSGEYNGKTSNIFAKV